MKCYRCGSCELVLAPLWPYERKAYRDAGIVLRIWTGCGLEQNHANDDECLTSDEAAIAAPSESV